MKKSSKPLIISVLALLIAFAVLLLAYVGVKLECELLLKEKFQAEEKLETEKNRQVNLLAQAQYLSSEERIVKIARDDLSMIRRSGYEATFTISDEDIEEISEALRVKYE